MKRNITKFLAALALIVCVFVPLGMKAAEDDVHDMNISQSTVLNNNAEIPSINIAAQSYSVKTVTINWRYNKTIENPVTIEVLVGGNSWGTQTITGNTTADAVFEGESTIGAIVINFTNNTGSGTGHGTFYVNSVKLTEGASSGPAPTTYTVTYHANISGIDDIEETYNEGATVTIADNTFSNPGYAFTEWNTEADGTGDSYDPGDEIEGIDDDIDLYAQWEQSSELTLTFPLNSNPGGWPTDNSTTLTEYTYTLNNVNYVFALMNVKCNSGYLMMTATAVLGLPAIEGYKLTKVVANNSGGCSTSTKVGVSSSSSSASYITGGEVQTWSTQGSQYTYNLTSTEANTMYYLYVTNKNAQVTQVALTYEMATAPTVATPIFTPESGTEFGDEGLSVTISCETTGANIYYTIDGTEPTTSSTLYGEAIGITATTTIKAIASDGTNNSSVATATYTYVDPNAPGTENNPYTVAQARAAIDAGTGVTGVYATGIVSENNYFSQNNGYITYFISEDGSTESDQLEAFHGMSYDGEAFTSANDIQVGDIVVIYGNLMKYHNNNTNTDVYEFESGNQLVSLERPISTDPSITLSTYDINVNCEEHDGTINLTAVNMEYYLYDITYYEEDGTTPTMYDWVNVSFNGNGTASYHIDANESTGRNAWFKIKALDLYGSVICYSDLVTVYQSAYEAPFEGGTYTLAYSIESGKTYIIASENYAMGADRGNNRAAVSVSPEGYDITVEPGQAVYEFVITSIDELDGYYAIYDPRNYGYLDAAGGTSNNYLKTNSWANTENTGQWAITIDPDFGIASIVANFGNEKANTQPRNTMRFNSSNNPPIFSCYGPDNDMKDIYLYEKVEAYNLEIVGYSDDDTKDGYHLIASPVTVDPSTVVGMTDIDFDLYYFDQSEEDEWRNYEDVPFMLEPGKGYLYAKKATYDNEVFSFILSGEPYTGDGYIDLTYDPSEGVSFPGLNLIGNPFGEEATLNLPFYRMNDEGSALVAVEETESTVYPMEGVFVYAEYDQSSGNVSNYAQFTTSGSNYGGGGMKLNVTSKRGSVVDNAIVRFDNGRQLPKFQLDPNSTKLYIPQGNKDFAIVRSAAEGEMPVSFKAAENGTYTLAVETENVEMNYLHLIDNLTGMDVDLLQTPSYTFEARTNDYTSRFRLVFKGNSTEEQTTETFAYFNGTSWTVSNLGEATLQVVDVIGRLVSSETINGNATINLNETPGIYMLRLVNGNDVKVQKVVVR